MNKIYFESNTFWLLRGYPDKNWMCVETIESCAYEINCFCLKHQSDVKACIAAKTKIDNFELIEEQVCYKTHQGKRYAILLKDGSIFDVPNGVEFEEITQTYTASLNSLYLDTRVTEKVIRLKMNHKIQFESNADQKSTWLKDKILQVKEESQDELWQLIQERLYNQASDFLDDRKWLKSNFKIQRIHPEQ